MIRERVEVAPAAARTECGGPGQPPCPDVFCTLPVTDAACTSVEIAVTEDGVLSLWTDRLATRGTLSDPAYVVLDPLAGGTAPSEPTSRHGLEVRRGGTVQSLTFGIPGTFRLTSEEADGADWLRRYDLVARGEQLAGVPLAAGDTLTGALWTQLPGSRTPAGHPMYSATFGETYMVGYLGIEAEYTDPDFGSYEVLQFSDASWGAPFTTVAGRFAVAEALRLVVTPDTLAPGDSATVALEGDVPGEASVRLTVAEDPDGVPGGFVVVDPELPTRTGARSVVGEAEVMTTVGEMERIRFVASPAGTTVRTANVTAEVDGEIATAQVVIEPDVAADTLVVSFSQARIRAGDSVAIEVAAFTAGGERLPRSAIADSTWIGLAAFSGPFGELVAGNKQGRVLRGVTWGEISDGAVTFVSNEPANAGCRYQDIAVFAGGAGVDGAGTIRVVLAGGSDPSPDGRSAVRNSCSSPVGVIETKDSIKQWVRDSCPDFVPDPVASKEEQQIDGIYERSLALHIGGGMGWGNIDGYPRPVDGFTRWYVDTNPLAPIRVYPQVSDILETKRSENAPIRRPGHRDQAEDHLAFLVSQSNEFYEDFQASYPNAVVALSIGGPLLIYASQNQLADDDGWRIARPGYNEVFLRQARDAGVAVMHMKVARAQVGPLEARWLAMRMMNPFVMVNSPSPWVDWIAERAALDLTGITYTTPQLFEFECDALSTPQSRPSPPPPGFGP